MQDLPEDGALYNLSGHMPQKPDVALGTAWHLCIWGVDSEFGMFCLSANLNHPGANSKV